MRITQHKTAHAEKPSAPEPKKEDQPEDEEEETPEVPPKPVPLVISGAVARVLIFWFYLTIDLLII